MNLVFRLRFLASWLFVCSLLLSALSAASGARPNVLLILTDDQGYGDLSGTGNPDIATPHLDRFASGAIKFDRFFVSSVCAPTRASLMTGRWWLRTGVCGVTQGWEEMRASEVTLAETLRGAGYRTGLFGKWHNGEQFPLSPTGQGFDEFLGFTAGHWNNYFDAELTRGTQPEKTRGYITDVLTDAAIGFIEKHRAAPFFCYLPYNAPHSPYQAPDRFFRKYLAKGLSPELAAIYAMTESVDENLGKLLAALERLQLRENTIVIFLTDNGATANPSRYNAGMRGNKASVHEGGVRVPCFVQYPARYKNPRVITEIAAHIDLYPTLLDLCGVPLPAGQPKLDGVSLVPLLAGRSEGWQERMLFSFQSPGAATLRKHPGAVRTQQYRAVLEGAQGAAPTWSLYDMVADPGQKENIAARAPEVLGKLSAAYDAWFADVTSAGFAREGMHVGHPEHNPVRLMAPRAKLEGKLRFFVPQAYANTWITEWTETADKISLPLSVARPGNYSVALHYACAPADAGSRIRATSGAAATKPVAVTAAVADRVKLPHRDKGKDNYVDRQWGRLELGTLALAEGAQMLTLEALDKKGAQVLELKHVELKRLD